MSLQTLQFLGRVDNVSIETNSDGTKSFVLHLLTELGTPEDPDRRRDYFRTQLHNGDSVRIASQQLKNAFPELMTQPAPSAVLREMLVAKSKFIGRDIEYMVVPQVDDHGAPKINPRTGEPYTNIRLVPSKDDIPADIVDQLLGTVATGTTAQGNEALPEDVPM